MRGVLVAALRTVGIPARQVYTPRWAHTDDNHAWVEAWADGQWYYLGACEPEPELNVAWFSSTALLNFTGLGSREGTMTWKSVFADGPVSLDCGQYLLTSGTRMASGKVLATLDFFRIEKGRETDVALVMREDSTELQVIGAMDAEAPYLAAMPDGSLRESAILNTTGRGFFVLAFLRAGHEPSNHAVVGICDNIPECPVLMLYGSESDYRKYLSGVFPEVPEGVYFGVDRDWSILDAVCAELKATKVEYPVFVIADTFGRIVYMSEGYNIGTAELIARLVRSI